LLIGLQLYIKKIKMSRVFTKKYNFFHFLYKNTIKVLYFQILF
jgi:hypothetical protein